MESNNKEDSMILKADSKAKMNPLLITLAKLLACIGLIYLAYIFFSPSKLVSFDIKGTTNTFLKQVASLNIDEEQKNAMVKRYNVALDGVIKEYESENYIVFVKDAVVSSNLDDKTNEIQKKIAQKMKGKGE